MTGTELATMEFRGVTMTVRPGSTDENVCREVLVGRCYRRPSFGFDVEDGERWLDLGGNIGAFSAYVEACGGGVVTYEPEPKCFELLGVNAPRANRIMAAVTTSREKTINLWSAAGANNFYRGTTLGGVGRMKTEPDVVRNMFVGNVPIPPVGTFDGVKMDIEGAELAIIDERLIPPCRKLCFEYHLSRDPSMDALARRLMILQDMFDVVWWPNELTKLMDLGGRQKSFHDRVIFCKGWRGAE